MFCPNCGTQNPDTATTCTKCGFNLKGSAAPKFKGTMLMMNAPPAPKPPEAAPAGGPAPAPAPAARPALKGTMLGVAPPSAGGVVPPAPAAPAAPAAPPPAAPAEPMNPLGATMTADAAMMAGFGAALGGAPGAGTPAGFPPPAGSPPGGAPPGGFGAPGGPPPAAPGGFGAPPPAAPGGFGAPGGPPPAAPGGFGAPPPAAPGGFGAPGGPPPAAPGGFGAPPPAYGPPPGAGQAIAPMGAMAMGAPAGQYGPIGKDRNPIVLLLLSWITCGLYYIIALFSMSKELCAFRQKQDISPIMFFIPILGWLEMMKVADKVYEAKVLAGLPNPTKTSGILYILLGWWFWPSEMNQVWAAVRQRGG